jgi:hypothetical protein
MRTSWPRVVIGTLSGVIALALLVGGAALLWVESTQRDGAGFYTSQEVPVAGDGRAIIVDDLHLDNVGVGLPQELSGRSLGRLVTLRVTARAQTARRRSSSASRRSNGLRAT